MFNVIAVRDRSPTIEQLKNVINVEILGKHTNACGDKSLNPHRALNSTEIDNIRSLFRGQRCRLEFRSLISNSKKFNFDSNSPYEEDMKFFFKQLE